ncbi:MAG: zinc ABC transporter substrate-binding protein [Sulfurimonas sp.]|nr:zinc ABC transporter substrate-binding protein [Sulfurimonas sp.]
MFKQIMISGLFGISSLLYAQVNIVVSILPQQTFVEKIGRDKVHVTTMVQPGKDPHSYEPKPSQMVALSKAQVYFPIKIGFENVWLQRFSQHNQKMKLSDMTKGIRFIKMAKHSHSHKKKSNIHYEWMGVFQLQKGIYHWSFSKVSGDYTDPSIKFLMIQATKNSDALIEMYEHQAVQLFNEGKTLFANDKDTLNTNDGLYQLQLNETKDQTIFRLDIKKSGKYLFFTEHMPLEFVDKVHYFKDMKKNDIVPIQTKPKNDMGLDPHTWTSPSNVKIMAKNIYDTLVDIDNKNKAYYKKNYEKFLREIAQTDEKIKNILSSLQKKSKFMVFHPSWGYFAKEYGLIQLAIEVEGKAPKLRMLEKIIKEARKENVKAIFAQKEFSDKSAKAIANELNIKVLKETPLAKNWSENLIKMAKAIANNG